MTSSFQEALRAGDLDAIRRFPKSDLHNHLVGGGNPAWVSAKTGVRIDAIEHKLASMAEMHAWADSHLGHLNTPEARLLMIEAAFVQAASDGVTRLEGGEDVWAPTFYKCSAAALTESLKEIHARVAPDVEWIPQLGMSRHCRIRDLDRWIRPFLELGFYRTIDLSGDELAQPIENFKPIYRLAKQHSLRLKAHVGEWGDADSVRRAVEELELDEVQHGIAAASSPAVMRFLADNRIRLNVCPTSNLMLGRVESLASHPIRKFYDAGIKVTINTDDMLMFGASVSDEFLNLYRVGCRTADELEQIRLNGLRDEYQLDY
jgi:adenosine deaminase